MSAPDFTARALALRAGALSPATFGELAQAALPAAINAVASSGYSAAGFGAGDYICDSKATAALCAAHPRAVFAAAGGRYFRLRGDAEGFITPEQLGCPAYAAGNNVQPIVQACLDYCKEVGLKGVKFGQAKYELWRTARTTASFTDYAATDGNYLVVDMWDCTLLSTNGRGTTFICKGPTGGNALTDYTVLNSATYGGDVIWRGAAIKTTGNVSTGLSNPGDDALSHITMKGITFDAQITASLNPAWPCWPPSRAAGRENAWDITMKGIWNQNDKLSGNITIIDGGFDGFLGEHIYCGGGLNTNQKLTCRNYVSRNTNGTSFNPNGPRLTDVDGAYCENVVGVIEGWMGWQGGSQFRNVRARKAGGGELKGGYEYDGSLRPDGAMPWADVDVVFEGASASASVTLGNFIRGRVELIDMFARVYAQSPTMLVENINVDLVVTAHLTSPARAVSFIGDPGGAQNVRNNTIRLDVRRTKEAQAAGRWVLGAVDQTNTLGPANYVYAAGYVPGPGTVTTPADNYVAVIDSGLDKSWSTYGTAFDPTTTASPEWGSHFLRCATFAGGAGVYTVNLPATTMYQDGDMLGITHRTSNSVFVELRNPGLTFPVALLGYQDTLRFRCNKERARWDLIDPPAMRRVTASVDIASTAAGAESGPYTIAAAGCRPWHSAEVRPPALVTGFAITAVRPETDQIRFWVKNLDGTNPSDPALQTFTANFGVRP